MIKLVKDSAAKIGTKRAAGSKSTTSRLLYQHIKHTSTLSHQNSK
jgi:hypothetical protein